TLHAFMATLQHGESLDRPHGKPECEVFEWVLPNQLKDYPMGKVNRMISLRLNKSFDYDKTESDAQNQQDIRIINQSDF
ncbi:MAG TPA: hypothetical protein PK459_01015, partial [Anaerolineaceae bacterium]|nr:hypothetical protein [Anaerolineaceae bacterium]